MRPLTEYIWSIQVRGDSLILVRRERGLLAAVVVLLVVALANVLIGIIELRDGPMEVDGPCGIHFTIPPVLWLVLSAVASIGLVALALYRRGLTIDRGRGTVTTWWRILRTYRRAPIPLGNIDAVVIDRGPDPDALKPYLRYTVSLSGGTTTIELGHTRKCAEAEMLASQVAGFAGLKTCDPEGDVLPEHHAPGEGNGRFRKTPDTPPGCRITSSVEQRGRAFDLPAPTWGPHQKHLVTMAVLLPLVMCWTLVLPFGLEEDDSHRMTMLIMFGTIVFGPPAWLLARAYSSMRVRERIIVARQALLIERKFLFTTRRKIPFSEWQGTFDGPDGLVLCTYKDSIHIGRSLTEEERAWLRETLLHLALSEAGDEP